MKSWFLLGGGAVIVAVVAIVLWVGDDTAPGPDAPGPGGPAPTADAPAAPPAPVAHSDPASDPGADGPTAESGPAPMPSDTEPGSGLASEPDTGQPETEIAAVPETAVPGGEPDLTLAPEGSASDADQGAVPTQAEESVARQSDESSDVPIVDDSEIAAAPETAAPAEGEPTAGQAPQDDVPDAAAEPDTASVIEPEPSAADTSAADTSAADTIAATEPDAVDAGQAPSTEETTEAPATVDQPAAASSLENAPETDQSATDHVGGVAAAPALPDQAPSTTPSDAANQPSEQPDGTGEPPVASAPPPPPAATTPDSQADQLAQTAPSFDAVRVNENGMIIIAGRAAPGATVTVTDNGVVIGTVVADDNGEFVFIGGDSLAPGDHEIGLASVGEGAADAVTASDQIVLLVVPEPGLTIADDGGADDGGANGNADTGDTGALAILVDRDDVAPTEILQVPAAPAGQPDTSSAETASDVAGGGLAEDRPSAVDAVPQDTPAADPSQPVVSIDVVDYDDDGRLIVAGRAVPGAMIILYLNNQPVGQATAAADGRYWLRPDQPVAPGLYTLRADHVGDDGAVVARAETPFQRTASLAGLPDNRQVVVQPGNNLWRLARRIYGQGLQYTVIYQANRSQIRNPDLIYPGQVFMLPAPPDQLPAGLPSRT